MVRMRMSKKIKTRSNPKGRDWPDEITLDVGSNMPMDVYGIRDNEFGVLYVRHDVATKRIQEAVENAKAS